jgi:hypothetical protein
MSNYYPDLKSYVILYQFIEDDDCEEDREIHVDYFDSPAERLAFERGLNIARANEACFLPSELFHTKEKELGDLGCYQMLTEMWNQITAETDDE